MPYNTLLLGADPQHQERSFVGGLANIRVFSAGLADHDLELIRSADVQGKIIYPFLNKLRALEGVPFNYLIPKEEQFPLESIAFGLLDSTWIQSLLDGAFSIGRFSNLRLQEDADILREMQLDAESECSVVMIRSASLQSWKDVMVEGYSTAVGEGDVSAIDEGRLPIIRK